jgi:hypothetical protein
LAEIFASKTTNGTSPLKLVVALRWSIQSIPSTLVRALVCCRL